MKKLLLALTLIFSSTTQGVKKSYLRAASYSIATALGSYSLYNAWDSTHNYGPIALPFLGLATIYCAGKAQQYWRRSVQFVKEAEINIRYYNQMIESDYLIVFSHGLGATGMQAGLYAEIGLVGHPYKKENVPVLTMPFATFNYADAINDRMMFNPNHLALGQEQDIERLYSAYQEVIKRYPDKKIILMGMSRGAATILNLMGDQEKDLSKVAGIIVEAPFDHIDSVLNNFSKKSCELVPGLMSCARSLAELALPLFDTSGIFPIERIKTINAHRPILLVSSKEDKIVPKESTDKLAQKLSKRDHFTYCELTYGRHGKYIFGKDKEKFAQAIKNFIAQL